MMTNWINKTTNTTPRLSTKHKNKQTNTNKQRNKNKKAKTKDIPSIRKTIILLQFRFEHNKSPHTYLN